MLVDTNVLLYAANRDAPEHSIARRFLEERVTGGAGWHLTWSNIYEFLRVSTHPRIFRRPLGAADAWGFISALCESPNLSVLQETERHGDVLAEIFRLVRGASGNFIYDCRIAALMREHDVQEIATRDSDFRKFPFVRVIDPFAPATP